MKMISNDLRSSCRAMLLGAYQGGGDTPEPTPETWEYPSNWLTLPEPAENQVILLADNRGNRHEIYSSVKISYIGRFSIVCTQPVHIDWGDGSSSDIDVKDGAVSHSYTAGSGHIADNSEQWIITVTFDADAADGTDYIKLLCYSVIYDMYFVAIKAGNYSYLYNQNSETIEAKDAYLHYIKICNGDSFKISKAYDLKKIELPKTIIKLPDRAFQNCWSLFDVDLSNITEIGEMAFLGCYNLNPSGKMPKLTKAGTEAFSYSGITDIDFPCLTEMGNNMFYGCCKLINVTLPETITAISINDFMNCFNLKTINLSNVESIGQQAFSACYNLQKIEGKKVITIANLVFSQCRCLKSADFPSCNSLGSDAFSYCYALSNCILHSGAEIGNAFRYCSSVKITYVEEVTT